MFWTLPICTTMIASYFRNISPSCPLEALIYLPAQKWSISETSCFQLLYAISDRIPTIDHLLMRTYADESRNIQNIWTRTQSVNRMHHVLWSSLTGGQCHPRWPLDIDQCKWLSSNTWALGLHALQWQSIRRAKINRCESTESVSER